MADEPAELVPKRTDLETILIIGSGPIVIGQACEFDYSGTQACRVLRDEGYRVVLVNSNPATIMTDPEFADATYVEPLDVQSLTRIIERERPDALLPTLGGQTALNLVDRARTRPGVLDRVRRRAHRRERRGDPHRREPRRSSRPRCRRSASPCPQLGPRVHARRGDGGRRAGRLPAHRAGRRSSSAAAAPASPTTPTSCARVAAHGLATSPVSEILIEQSIAGWKEYELEVMRDHADNVVVICSIENFDAMGVHTGDSITVAPAQTLTDVEYQRMRDAAFACIRRIGVDTGGSNIQFAVNPANGDMVVIEMNPRVSRSRARSASKATGFPIAKIAARLAVGYRLDEIMNDITGETPASFEPTIDYVVTKVPRWAFEKLPGRVAGARHDDAVGRRGDGDRAHVPRDAAEGAALARDRALGAQLRSRRARVRRALRRRAGAHGRARATPERPFLLDAALRRGVSVERLHEATGIDPWFLDQLRCARRPACVAAWDVRRTT